MTKLANTLNRLDALHQTTSDTAERISLAHIDTAGLLKARAERFSKMSAKGKSAASEIASTFTVGQQVRTVRRMGADFLTGTVVEIDGGTIAVDVGGSVRKFAVSALVSA